MSQKLGWASYSNGEFVPDSEDFDPFESLPSLPPPPPGYIAELHAGFQSESDESLGFSLPPFPPPPPGYFSQIEGGFRTPSKESSGGALEEGLTVNDTPVLPIRRPMIRRYSRCRRSLAMKKEESDLLRLLCTEKWEDVLREREEAAVDDDTPEWLSGCTPAVRGFLEIYLQPVKRVRLFLLYLCPSY